MITTKTIEIISENKRMKSGSELLNFIILFASEDDVHVFERYCERSN